MSRFQPHLNITLIIVLVISIAIDLYDMWTIYC